MVKDTRVKTHSNQSNQVKQDASNIAEYRKIKLGVPKNVKKLL